MKIAVVEVRSSSRTSTSTHNPRPIPGHPHSTRKSRITRVATTPRIRPILATMPIDAALENAWYHASQTHQATGTIPGWGDAICFNELHHTTPYHNTWD